MDTEEFRAAGHALVDWIADHRASTESRRVLADVGPGDVRAGFPEEPPASPIGFDEMLTRLQQRVVPGVTEVQHPMHFGWFPSNAALASILGDMASSGLSNLGISWESSPALTEVEEVVCDWLRQLTGLSDGWLGSIHDTASTACLVALLAARERASELSQNTGGLQSVAAPLVVYTTDQAHSSVAKAALLAGYGWDNIRSVPTDPDSFAMDPNALGAAIEADRAAGRVPAVVVATVGTTGTTAIDPVGAIVDVVRSGETSSEAPPVWIHVDAAMAGSAMLLPEYRHLWDGVEGSDSIAWNPHKWMGTILDCALLYVRHVDELQRVMSTNPSYLQSPNDGAVTQYRDWGVPLGRRFRSLKLWFHLELDGIEAIRERLRRDLANAAWFAEQVESTPGWTVLAPVSLQTVCVVHRPDRDGDPLDGEPLDEHTLAWVRAINESGEAFLTPSILDGRWMARVSIGVESTERHHVAALWELMQAEASKHATGQGDQTGVTGE